MDKLLSELACMSRAYVETACWVGIINEQGEEVSFDNLDISLETKLEILSDCLDFLQANYSELKKCGLGWDQIGHDFFLTRNGHGAGFWDRGLGAIGEVLSNAAETHGNVSFYFADNGKVYQQ